MGRGLQFSGMRNYGIIGMIDSIRFTVTKMAGYSSSVPCYCDFFHIPPDYPDRDRSPNQDLFGNGILMQDLHH